MLSRLLFAVGTLALLVTSVASAQNRTIRSEKLQLDDSAVDGTRHTITFDPGALAQNVVLTIPDPGSSTASLMLSTGSGGSFWDLTGNAGTTPGTNFLGTTDVQALHLYVNNGTGLNSNSLILNTNGSLQRDVGGDARGGNAVDLQIARGASTQVASGILATIGGGSLNTASGTQTTIGGGESNTASGIQSTIGGGRNNATSALHTTVGGGDNNMASGSQATVGGGVNNTAMSDNATVAGGSGNTASNTQTTVGGGGGNTASGVQATIGGGGGNTASGVGTSVAGGLSNTALAILSTIGGGQNNSTQGFYSAIPGGRGLTLSAHGTFGFLGGNNAGTGAGDNPMTIAAANTAVFGNTDLWLANNDNDASQLRFYEANATTGTFPGATNYTSFEAGAQTGDINYILPTTTAATTTVEEGVLQHDAGTGQLSWVDPSVAANAWNLDGNAATTPGTDYVGTSDAQALHLLVNGGTDNSLILNTNGSIQRDNAGNARGDEAVDLQRDRAAAQQVASGRHATISGGVNNRASGSWATMGGGDGNLASNEKATVGGGQSNTASSFNTTVGGGDNNTASGNSATIGGGGNNTASTAFATVGGGQANRASGDRATVAGGVGNTARGGFSAIPGGRGLRLNGNGSFGFVGNNAVGTNSMTIADPNIAVFGNTDLWLANNDNDASQIRFYEANSTTGAFPGATNYTSFEAGTQTADINYVLPTAAPMAATAGTDLGAGYMETTNTGTMSWRQSAVVTATNLNFGTVAGQTSSDVTVTVTGAAVGDIVNLGIDNAAVVNNSSYHAWVSAANTVTVRCNNYGAGAIIPATTNSFKVQVTK